MKYRAEFATLFAFALSIVLPVCASEPADDDAGWLKSTVLFKLDTNVVNGCDANGDAVHIVGEGLITLKTRVSADGTVELRERDNFTGDGTDASGSQYHFFELAHIDTSVGPNPDNTPFSYSERRRQTLIGMGGVPNQVITFNVLLVIDGSGNVTVDIFDFQLECH